MYSKNDYRYYLEHRMAEENYLAHYGVKGMKWKIHKAKKAIGEFIYPSTTVSFDDGSTMKLDSKQHSKTGKITKKKFTTREKSIEQRNLENLRKSANARSGNKTAHGKIDYIARKSAYNTAVKQYSDNQKTKNKIGKALKPKNQKVEIVTSPSHKRSKKEAKWNKEMQNYGKEILAEQNKTKKRR